MGNKQDKTKHQKFSSCFVILVKKWNDTKLQN